jgi:hypothetical protein
MMANATVENNSIDVRNVNPGVWDHMVDRSANAGYSHIADLEFISAEMHDRA